MTWSSERPRRAFIAVSLSLALSLATSLATSSAVSAATLTATAGSVSSAIAEDAVSLRRDVSHTLRAYDATYRSLLTPTEQRHPESVADDADLRLAAVVRETARLQAAVNRGASTAQIDQAQARSQAAWARAQGSAEASLDSVRLILEPRMTLLQKIEALSDYTRLMQRFEDLGERIDTLT